MPHLPDLWHAAIIWLATHAVTPTVHRLGISQAAGDPREIAEAVLIASLQLLLIAGVMRPLESLMPAERLERPAADHGGPQLHAADAAGTCCSSRPCTPMNPCPTRA